MTTGDGESEPLYGHLRHTPLVATAREISYLGGVLMAGIMNQAQEMKDAGPSGSITATVDPLSDAAKTALVQATLSGFAGIFIPAAS